MSSTIVSGQRDLTIEITPFKTPINSPWFEITVFKGEDRKYSDDYASVYINGYLMHDDGGMLSLTLDEWTWVRSKYERVLETQLAYLRGELDD